MGVLGVDSIGGSDSSGMGVQGFCGDGDGDGRGGETDCCGEEGGE